MKACLNCSLDFVATRKNQKFCNDKCRVYFSRKDLQSHTVVFNTEMLEELKRRKLTPQGVLDFLWLDYKISCGYIVKESKILPPMVLVETKKELPKPLVEIKGEIPPPPVFIPGKTDWLEHRNLKEAYEAKYGKIPVVVPPKKIKKSVVPYTEPVVNL